MIIKKFREVFGKTGIVIKQYPMVLTMAILAAMSVICYVRGRNSNSENGFIFLKLTIVFSLAISLMFAFALLAQRIGKLILLQLIGLAFLLLFYFILPNEEKDFTEVYTYLLIPTFLLSHLLVSFLSFLTKNKEDHFWQYNKNLFINFFLTVVFTGVLTGGIMLAIFAVDHLFNFHFEGRYYSYPLVFF